MDRSTHSRLLRRELVGSSRYTNVKALYGDRRWIRDLDIVNELNGHDGCVNALSWSKGGGLLASGSDDQRLNIHQFLPDNSDRTFKLATTVQTGHTANIFSVKFMPHSNDRTLVTAAGDSQIRVFDIEYSGRSSVPSANSIPGADRLQTYLHNGTQLLSHADTNARVYRSHSDRVKRIVTESSPYLFLSCSEDGEVRQWDLRQPSSAYPKPRGGRGWRSEAEDDDTGVPPPLISYKRYHLDLNTISCSPSQPYYIALGGAHLHAFLHDRRMLGRDRHAERGASVSSSGYSDHDDHVLSEATQCVRRFAPNGQQRMKRSDSGHITACKISDAHPNEMVASWSGDYIYSFDLVRSPDARSEDSQSNQNKHAKTSKSKHSKDRKRKRTKEGSVQSQEEAGRAGSKPRTSATSSRRQGATDATLRVQYENGQSESIPIRDSEERNGSLSADAAASTMSEAQRTSWRIADTSVKIRKRLFGLGTAKEPSERDPTGHAASLNSVLGFSASILQDMDEVIRSWEYPVVDYDDELEIALQTTLRRNRDSARRFVQACGTVARLLGGQLRTAGSSPHPMLDHFARIVPAPNEATILNSSEQFRYDFIKAIVLWLDSGLGAVAEGFSSSRNASRFPLPQDAGADAVDEKLIPYLLRLAGDRPVINVDASRFEVDENRKVFSSERAAVIAFASALKMPFEDLSRAISLPASSEHDAALPVERLATQDRKAALRFWGLKVARGLLLAAGEGVNHAFIDRAFGGLGKPSAQVESEERALNERLEDVDAEEDDPAAASIGLHTSSSRQPDGGADMPMADEGGSDEAMVPVQDVRAVIAAAVMGDSDDDDEDNDHAPDEGPEAAEDASSGESGSDESDNDEEDDDDEEASMQSFLFRSALERSSLRTHVQTHVPCSPHTRVYRGHCNVKTVKDVNFFGLNDEYVVSGSDSGHLFIWDKATSELVNILEGDGEVVNVVQGHPYEPMLAVSGIDHTIKIFSPDGHARRAARKGIGITSVDASSFSSLRYGRTRFGGGRRAPRASTGDSAAEPVTSEPAVPAPVDDSSDDDDDRAPVARNGLSSRKRIKDEYSITSQNDADRRGGQREAFITRSMLAQLAARMRLQVTTVGMGGGGGGGGGDGEGDDDDGDEDERLAIQFEGGGGVVLGEDCEVM